MVRIMIGTGIGIRVVSDVVGESERGDHAEFGLEAEGEVGSRRDIGVSKYEKGEFDFIINYSVWWGVGSEGL